MAWLLISNSALQTSKLEFKQLTRSRNSHASKSIVANGAGGQLFKAGVQYQLAGVQISRYPVVC